ncbi:hypothetical protein Bxe_A1933 [Paraburkholderia xenovorans LB400]|uniref:Uncharacterized protein n=1 Tax=Paraburkholderia xenovorans (strain LB400) TaxID=266265 RepID=Q13Y07_PARXL|nr:hypothetical protein Bxe_A1933 [Paraburkholderia xenovorans LB400]
MAGRHVRARTAGRKTRCAQFARRRFLLAWSDRIGFAGTAYARLRFAGARMSLGEHLRNAIERSSGGATSNSFSRQLAADVSLAAAIRAVRPRRHQ